MGNVNLNPDQTNTKHGGIIALAGEDLTGKRSRLTVGGNASGALELTLPTTAAAFAIYLLDEEGEDGDDVAASPLDLCENVRILAKSTGNAGDVLVLADPGTAADKGKVRAIPTTEGVYFSPGIAEESFVDGQRVLVRPCPRIVHVGAAFTGAAPASTAPTNSSPYGFGQAQAQAILDTVRELRAWAIANGFKANNA